MVPTSTLMRASRPLFRQAAFSSPASQAFRAQRLAGQGARFRFRDSGRRWQSTADGTQQQQSWFKRMWESEIGVKTVHFWAPVMKVRRLYQSNVAIPIPNSTRDPFSSDTL
ncbi:hypothetical protein E4U21_002124 [Claviceps maximensis]|nr:hypothetical protein E4U21_002124 [Claviceps maximensis]